MFKPIEGTDIAVAMKILNGCPEQSKFMDC